MNEAQLKEIILKAVTEAVAREGAAGPAVDPGEVPDLSAVDYRQVVDVPHPANEEEYRLLRSQTVARLGVWRAGPRYRTNTFLRFRADHAVAMDAVFTDVPEALLEELGLFTVQTLCDSKDDYLTRPDLGRRLSDETVAELRKRCVLTPTSRSWSPTASPAPPSPPTSRTCSPPSSRASSPPAPP